MLLRYLIRISLVAGGFPIPGRCRKNQNQRLLSSFERLLGELGQEVLPEDRIVVEYFLQTDRHVSLADLRDALRPMHPQIDTPSIRRAMRLLCDLGIAQQLSLQDNLVYEHIHLESHHDHLVCVRCGAIEEFYREEIEASLEAVCAAAAFAPLMHKLEIRGLCKACAESMPATRALTACLVGESVVLAEIAGGQELKRRLTAMGLTRGTPLRVLNIDGPVVLEVRGSRLAIGLGQASKIIVTNQQPEQSA